MKRRKITKAKKAKMPTLLDVGETLLEMNGRLTMVHKRLDDVERTLEGFQLNGTTFAQSIKDAIDKVDFLAARNAFLTASLARLHKGQRALK